MARFDVYPNPGKQNRSVPFVLDVQSDLLEELSTRMVIPLRSIESLEDKRPAAQLTPVFEIQGHHYVLETQSMGAIPTRVLKHPIASLRREHAVVTAALDFLFHGF